MELQKIEIEVSGVVVKNNLPDVLPALLEAARQINTKPKTDDEFAQTKEDVKRLKAVEDALKETKAKTIEDISQIANLHNAIDKAVEELAKIRLAANKAVTDEEAARKKQWIQSACDKVWSGKSNRNPIESMLKPLLLEAIKGRRTQTSIESAIDSVVIVNNERIAKNCDIIERVKSDGLESLFPDCDRLILEKRTDSLEDEVKRRIEADELRRQREEQKRKADDLQKRLDENKRKEKESIPPVEAIEQLQAVRDHLTEDESENKPEMTKEQEWVRFKSECIESFRAVKAAREKLKYSGNIAKAQGMASAMNSAWENWA